MNLHFLTIKKFLPYLIENYVIESEVNSLVYKSYSKAFLTHDDLDEISKKKSPIKKMKELCEKLLHTEKLLNYAFMYETLIKEFADRGREHIVEKLRKTLQETRQLLLLKEQTLCDCYYETIKDNFQYLIENYSIECQISSLAIAMFSNNFIDMHDLESINKTTMNEEKMSKLLQKLLRRERLIDYKNVYEVMVDEISKDCSDVVDELNMTLNKIKENHKKRNEKSNCCSDMQSTIVTKQPEVVDESLIESVMMQLQNPLLEPGSRDLHIADTRSVAQPLPTNVELKKEKHNSEEANKGFSDTHSSSIRGESGQNPKLGTSPFYSFSGFKSVAVAKELIDACYDNDIIKVKGLLDEGTDVNAANASGCTALIASSREGYTDLVEMLLKHRDIDVNARDVDGATALVEACYKRHHRVIKLLLTHKRINVNLAKHDGYTPLMFAAERDADVTFMLLNRPEIDVNARDKWGATALIEASYANHVESVHLLLSHADIDVNAAKKDTWTALLFAAERGHALIVEMLLSHSKIDVSKANRFNNTALDVAIKASHASIVAMLRAHKRK